MKVYPSICLQGFYIFLPSDIFNEFIIISLASLCFEWAEEDIVNRHTNKSSILKSISKQKETCVRYWSRQLFLNAPNDWIISLFLFFFSFFQNSTIYGVSLWWKAKRQSRKSTCFFFFFGSYIYFSFFFFSFSLSLTEWKMFRWELTYVNTLTYLPKQLLRKMVHSHVTSNYTSSFCR